jgi:superfamily I DNA/RNA helicase
VSVNTVHWAKGRERQHVIVTGCVQGRMPITYDPYAGRWLNASELEQERKLFYVALTRAQATLTLTCPLRRGNDGRISHYVEKLVELADAAGCEVDYSRVAALRRRFRKLPAAGAAVAR